MVDVSYDYPGLPIPPPPRARVLASQVVFVGVPASFAGMPENPFTATAGLGGVPEEFAVGSEEG